MTLGLFGSLLRRIDYYEVGLLVGACFLVNYVTVDGKTNFSEGFTMISFYVIIVSWKLSSIVMSS